MQSHLVSLRTARDELNDLLTRVLMIEKTSKEICILGDQPLTLAQMGARAVDATIRAEKAASELIGSYAALDAARSDAFDRKEQAYHLACRLIDRNLMLENELRKLKNDVLTAINNPKEILQQHDFLTYRDVLHSATELLTSSSEMRNMARDPLVYYIAGKIRRQYNIVGLMFYMFRSIRKYSYHIKHFVFSDNIVRRTYLIKTLKKLNKFMFRHQ